jgi:DnaK suppressor protein
MTAEHLKRLEQRLIHERERVLKVLANFKERTRQSLQEDDGELSNYPFHPADEGTDTIEQEKEYLLASQEGRLLYAIDDALRTIYKEPHRYGSCDACGSGIAIERLEIVPWTRMCVDCQRAEESGRAAA